jgi:DNA-binding FadR family transcriptional regulator
VSRSVGKASAERLSAFRPLAAPRSLAHELIERLSADITSGRLAPGARLPTEQELIAATGVSRTVVREAVAALRAEGLVVTRQGVGAFVADNAHRPFRIELNGLRSLRAVLQVMELRTGIEIEAAGLAAERASTAECRRIVDAFDRIKAAIVNDESAVDEDFAFHCAIAGAAGNPQFLSLLRYLGRFIIPRQTVRVAARSAVERRRYLDKIQREHRDILDAIRAGSISQARSAMRRHLLNSRHRYQKLAEKIGES